MINLKKLRADTNLTQEELANKLGITREYVSMLETDNRIPSTPLIYKMASLVNLDYKDFIAKYGN